MRDPHDPTEARLIRRPGGSSAPPPSRPPPATTADDTIRLRRRAAPGARGSGRLQGWIGGTALGLLLAGLLAWGLWPTRLPPPPPHAAPAPAAPAVGPAFAIRTATRSQILAADPTTLAVFRYAANPNIVVLDFPTLREQGLMLDRVAALVEKSGLPRNRVVSWADLLAMIHQHGDTVATYYYGHDYSAAALARFFALAQQDQRHLNPQEHRLHALLAQLGWLRPGVTAGLITLSKVGANRNVTAAAADAILTHELSHGEYFSTPAYAAYVQRFWRDGLTAGQRAAIRRFLGSEEYDITQHELVVNEMQAYLMFTHDKDFFRAGDIGITPAKRVRIEHDFLAGMPPGWLRNRLAELSARR